MPAKSLERYEYRPLFLDYIERGARRSAATIVPQVMNVLRCTSVLDVGCGAGAWLAEYQQRGVDDVIGIDGNYVSRDRLLVTDDLFRALDVSESFDLGRRFDLVQSLEVAEHLPQRSSRTFVRNLVAHGDRVLFSAAVPGQGGENHINEQTLEFWRRLFADQGYVPFDFIRPIVARSNVEPWYAYNILLYVRESAITSLPDQVRNTQVHDQHAIPVVASVAYRIRYTVLKPLPVWLISMLAGLKHRLIVALQLKTP